jgi:predicted nuclease of predicted toxin-antitoxin system
MRLYLDEDSAESDFVQVLRGAGHDVQTPIEARMLGEEDPVQFAFAIRNTRAILTHNHDHFEDLHDLIVEAGGHHFGVLVIRRENNPRLDMTWRGAATAIGKLLAAGVQLADSFYVLNQWR